MPDSANLFFPALAPFYAAAGPLVEALLRVLVGLWLIPHSLRMGLGYFPDSRGPVKTVGELGAVLERLGYRPGLFWAWVILLTEFIGGPLLALGLCTRLAAIPIFILLALGAWQRRRRFFWNDDGFEYPLLWAVAVLYFLINGGGLYSLDTLIGRTF